MLRETIALLRRYRRWLDAARSILVIGQGYIGRNVSRVLAAGGVAVESYDTTPGLGTVSNGPTEVAAALRSASIVIGCTGTTCLTVPQIESLADGTLLINMASSDIEFGLWRFPRSAFTVALCQRRAGVHPGPWRNLYRLKTSCGEVLVANGGFPINFSGAIDPIPPALIQLTRTLLAAGAIQATNAKRGGLQPLDVGLQRSVVREFARMSKDQ
jgi:hypothetical protein